MLQFVAVCCSVLQSVAACCSVLQCLAVRCKPEAYCARALFLFLFLFLCLSCVVALALFRAVEALSLPRSLSFYFCLLLARLLVLALLRACFFSRPLSPSYLSLPRFLTLSLPRMRAGESLQCVVVCCSVV